MLSQDNQYGALSDYAAKHRWPWHAAFWLMYIAGRVFSYLYTIFYFSQKVLMVMLMGEMALVALVYFSLWVYRKTSKLNMVLITFPIWIGYVALISYSRVYFFADVDEIGDMNFIDHFIANLKPYLLTFFILVLAKNFKDSFIKQYYDQLKEKLNLKSELKNLKAQVSPHFLFNTMNNFYGLAVEKSDKLPDLMVRLSSLLRYSLYETQSTTVPLMDEIAYLQNYAELEKIRLEEDLIFAFDTDLAPHQDFRIAPLLLIILVENAFKHARKMVAAPMEIKINLNVNAQAELHMEVKNNCIAQSPTQNQEKGIGLHNLHKRLETLYPKPHHDLEIRHDKEYFTALLKINLEHLTHE